MTRNRKNPIEPESNEYVLGTHTKELWRLGFQHQVWLAESQASWQKAKFSMGDTLLDLGCGPGFASRELAYLVGENGKVLAVDKSKHYIDFLDEISRLHRLSIETHLADLNALNLAEASLDGAYCRWVLGWLDNAEAIVSKVAKALKVGAPFVVQEYFDWEVFQTEPQSQGIKVALKSILASFDQHPGEINIGRRIPEIFDKHGLKVESVQPLTKICRPQDLAWNWPKTFLEIYLPRVVELGFLAQREMEIALEEWQILEQKPNSMCFTPPMIEIIGRKR